MAAAPAVSFFAQQDRARSAARTLVLLYVLSLGQGEFAELLAGRPIAHEFSHILNGDIQLNLRAVACVLDCPMPPGVAALDPRLLRK